MVSTFSSSWPFAFPASGPSESRANCSAVGRLDLLAVFRDDVWLSAGGLPAPAGSGLAEWTTGLPLSALTASSCISYCLDGGKKCDNLQNIVAPSQRPPSAPQAEILKNPD